MYFKQTDFFLCINVLIHLFQRERENDREWTIVLEHFIVLPASGLSFVKIYNTNISDLNRIPISTTMTISFDYLLKKN